MPRQRYTAPSKTPAADECSNMMKPNKYETSRMLMPVNMANWRESKRRGDARPVMPGMGKYFT